MRKICRINYLVVVFAIILITSLFSCSKNTQKPKNVIAELKKTGDKYTYDDLNYTILSIEKRRRYLYNGIEGRRKLVHDYIRYYMFYHEAQKLGFTDSIPLKISFKFGNYYKIAGLYRNIYLIENITIPMDTLLNFYRNNKDSLYKKWNFIDAKEKILNDYVAKKIDLKNYYNTHKDQFKLPTSIKIAHIFSKNRSKIEKAYYLLKKKNENFFELARKMSDDTITGKLGGILGTYKYNRLIWKLNIKESNEIFDKLSKMKDSTYTSVIKTSQGYHIFYLIKKNPEKYIPYEKVKNRIVVKYINNIRDSLFKFYIDSLRKWYNYTIDLPQLEFKDSILKNYYKVHKKDFISDMRKFSAIRVKSWKKAKELVKIIGQNSTKFDSIRNVYSEDKKDYGFVFKETTPFPEIGRELWKLNKIGQISKEFKTDSGFYIIRLDSIVKNVQKPFDVAKDSIVKRLIIKEFYDSLNKPIINVENSLIITRGDYINYIKSKPKELRDYYFDKNNITSFFNSLLDQMLYYYDAQKRGYFNDGFFKVVLKYSPISYWAYIYDKNYISKYYGFDPKEIKTFYEKYKSRYHFKNENGQLINKFEDLNNDQIAQICADMYITPQMLKEYYYMNLEHYRIYGKLAKFETVKDRVKEFASVYYLYKHKIEVYKQLFKKYEVVFYDSLYIPDVLLSKKRGKVYTIKQLDSLLATADSMLTKNRTLTAMNIYKQIIESPSAKGEVLFKAKLNLARLYDENKKYGKAYQLYNELLKEFKGNKDLYKVYFLLGFMFQEKLKRPDLAKPYFEKVVKDYPKSDLADDAKILLKSGK